MPPLVWYQVADLLAIAGVVASVGYYTFLAPWWREAFGTTLVLKDALLGLLLGLSALSLFWKLNRLTSEVVAWAGLVLFMGIGPVLFWRTVVFGQLAVREGRDWAPKWLRRLLDLIG